MKRLTHLLVIFLVLAGIAWALWRGFTHRTGDSDDEGAKAEAPAKAEVAGGKKEKEEEKPGVELDREKMAALGLEVKELAPMELGPRRAAWGRVLDPTPLVALAGELQTAEAALAASRAEYERSQKLLAGGENTSRKAAETAEAQFRADESKAAGLRRSATLQWGPRFVTLAPAARGELIDRLVAGQSALVRVEVLPGDFVSDSPKLARVTVAGRPDEVLVTKDVTAAPDVDAKTQAQGFLLRVEQASFPLPPGLAVTAWLELPGEPRAGFAVPRAALLRHEGAAWVYAQEEEGRFERVAVALDTPLEGGAGWFVPAAGGELKAGEKVVTQGAASLLGAELKAGAKEKD